MEYIDPKGVKWWLNTADTRKGPWHVTANDQTHRWYIINIETGEHEYIGPWRWSGRNYFDEANAECKVRNGETDE